jgi:hypothetical protein
MGDSAVAPNGTADFVFQASVTGAITNVALSRTDASGACPSGSHAQYDTITGSSPIPPSMAPCSYNLGSATYVLGVSIDGGATLANTASGSLPALPYGAYSLKVYADYDGSNGYYVLSVQFADGTIAKSAPAQILPPPTVSPVASGTSQHIKSVWAESPTDAWIVALGGTIQHWNGTAWSASASGTANDLFGLWASSSTDVWAVGAGGLILHWNGSAWSPVPSGTTGDLYTVWGNSSTDVWAAGPSGAILHWNGSAWSASASGTTQDVYGIWSQPGSAWAVGLNGMILRWNGTSWSSVASGTSQTLIRVWGSAANDVWVAGGSGTILHWDGTLWLPVTSGTSNSLLAIGGTSVNDVWIAGDNGTLLHHP